MGLALLAAFIGVPIIEIAVFIEVGGWIGLWPTLGLVVLTAIVGSLELRAQGLATVNRVRREIDQGVLPAQALFDGVCLLFAGALLLTPGFVTDAVGILLFVPGFRAALRRVLARYIQTHAQTRVYVDGEEVRRRRPGYGPGVVDAEYREVDDEEEGARGGRNGKSEGRRLPR